MGSTIRRRANPSGPLSLALVQVKGIFEVVEGEGAKVTASGVLELLFSMFESGKLAEIFDMPQ